MYSAQSGKDDFKEIKKVIDSSPSVYEQISEDWRRKNFVMAVSVIYFLHNKEDKPDFLFPWLFQLLQHQKGNIRHSAVRMIQNELGPLTYHIRFHGEKSSLHEFSPEQADRILFGLRANLDNLIAGSYKPSYRKHKYIDSLPSGTYKSAQLILSLLDGYCSEVES